MTQIDGIDLISFALKDKYGEYGIIAVVVLKHNEGAATIDSFLMSCRVLGRNIEDAILAVIEEVARERDADRLLGLYSPTAKNQQVEGFYVSKGFEGIEGSDSDCMFQRTLSAKTIYQIPPHTHISYPGES
jgi:FkbH-like protein